MTDTDATALEALAVRLGGGETGREIDGIIATTLDGFTLEVSPDGEKMYCYRDSEGVYVRPGNAGDMSLPHYSTSLDACAALAERVLPGWGFYLRKDNDGCGCGMVYPDANFVTPSHRTAPTPAGAMLAAILRAKAKGGE